MRPFKAMERPPPGDRCHFARSVMRPALPSGDAGATSDRADGRPPRRARPRCRLRPGELRPAARRPTLHDFPRPPCRRPAAVVQAARRLRPPPPPWGTHRIGGFPHPGGAAPAPDWVRPVRHGLAGAGPLRGPPPFLRVERLRNNQPHGPHGGVAHQPAAPAGSHPARHAGAVTAGSATRGTRGGAASRASGRTGVEIASRALRAWSQ